MGLLQPHVGHRRGDRESGLSGAAKAIVVHSLAQAKAAAAAAAETGVPVLLLSAPAAAESVGPAWFEAVVALAARDSPAASVAGVLDCGGEPGHALAALRHGLKIIRYDGPSGDAIADIAAQCGAEVWRARPCALDLSGTCGGHGDAATMIEACRRWLRG